MRVWEQKHEPPFHPWGFESNQMYTWRGLPTIFGNPICDTNEECDYKRIVQYSPDRDEWINIGEAMFSRRFFDLIPVPAEFCDNFIAPGSKVAEESKYQPYNLLPPLEAPKQMTGQNAALIIGGFTQFGEDPRVSDVVELFGCDGVETDTIALAPFPKDTYLPAGAHWMENGKHMIAVCGGYHCFDNACALERECYTYSPETNTWDNSMANLVMPRYAHFMHLMPNLNTSDPNDENLSVYGYHLETEIYDHLGSGQWEIYFNKTDRVFSVDCVVYNEDDGYIYAIANQVIRIDPQTGDGRVLTTPPEALLRPGRCAKATINGMPGLLTRWGFW